MDILNKFKGEVETAAEDVKEAVETTSNNSQVPPFKHVCKTEGCKRIEGHVLPHSDLNGHDWS
jgi:hypothetical protein